MVELEDQDVALATLHAVARAQEVVHQVRGGSLQARLVAPVPFTIGSAIRNVVAPRRRGAAYPTPRVPLLSERVLK